MSAKNRRTPARFLVLLLFFLVACNPPKYGDIMRNAFQAALGGDFKEYQFRSYPVDNFGVWTMYDGTYDPSNFLCATWSCLGVAPTQIPSDATALLNVNGNVDPGHGGNITLTTDQKQSIGVNVVVPQILSILSVDAGVDWQKHVTVTLVATGGHQRFVIAQKLADYLNTLPANDVRRIAYKKGTLTVVISDLVIDALSVTIDLDSTLTTTLDAKLSQALQGRTGTIIGQGADLSYKVTSATTGHYQFQTVSSVIVAMLSKTEPKPQGPARPIAETISISNFDAWKTTHKHMNDVKSVTKKPLQVQ